MIFLILQTYILRVWTLLSNTYHLESRWRNSHVLVYHSPWLSHLLGVAPSTFSTVLMLVWLESTLILTFQTERCQQSEESWASTYSKFWVMKSTLFSKAQVVHFDADVLLNHLFNFLVGFLGDGSRCAWFRFTWSWFVPLQVKCCRSQINHFARKCSSCATRPECHLSTVWNEADGQDNDKCSNASNNINIISSNMT